MLKKLIFCTVCCSAVLVSETSEGMKPAASSEVAEESKGLQLGWPEMAYDGTPENPEPTFLETYHAKAKRQNGCQMPKDQKEFDLVYAQYKAGNFKNDMGFFSWHYVLFIIGAELSFRLGTGNIFLIDKYLDRIEVFLNAVSKCEDHDFIAPLFPKLSKTLIESGAWMTYTYTRPLRHYPGDRVLTAQDAKDIINRLNNICNKSGLFEQDLMKRQYDYNAACEKARGNQSK